MPITQVQQAQAAIEIVSPGLQTLVQDAGRNGMAGLGICASGALDLPAMHAANRMVGNPIDAPVLENICGQLQLRSHGASTVAVAGAQAALSIHTRQGTQWSMATPATVALNEGDCLQLHAPTAGVRSYVAVRGGWQIEPVLGSCATDTLAGVGPAALQAGQRIAVGGAIATGALRAVQAEAPLLGDLPRAGDEVVLDVTLGPRTDWFTQAAVQTFLSQAWVVTPQSSRVGMRLEGAQPLERSRPDELPSEGTVVGAIQVPINGQPVLFLADHPLTGGYPVIAAITSYHLALAAQIPVGCRIRFRAVSSFSEPFGRMAEHVRETKLT